MVFIKEIKLSVVSLPVRHRPQGVLRLRMLGDTEMDEAKHQSLPLLIRLSWANIGLSDDQPVESAAELPEAPVEIKSKPSKKSKATLPVVAIEVNDEDAL